MSEKGLALYGLQYGRESQYQARINKGVDGVEMDGMAGYGGRSVLGIATPISGDSFMFPLLGQSNGRRGRS